MDAAASLPDLGVGGSPTFAPRPPFAPALLDAVAARGLPGVVSAALRGFRNGVLYGARVRAPHALVLNLVWGGAGLSSVPARVLRVTATHALGLGLSAVLFAAVRGLLRGLVGPPAAWHNTVAGFCIGALVWGDPRDGVHAQMILYKLARVLVGLYRVLAARAGLRAPRFAYAVFAGAVWAASLTLMEASPDALQPTMQRSLEYIFLDRNLR